MAAEGQRRWLRQEKNKNDFNNGLAALIFVSGVIQTLFNASPMVPINGEHSPRVGVVFRPIVTSIFDVTIGPTSTGQKLRFPSAPESAPDCQRHTTDDAATLVLTLGVPEVIFSRAVEAHR